MAIMMLYGVQNDSMQQLFRLKKNFVIPTKEESGFKYLKNACFHPDSSFGGMIKPPILFKYLLN